MDNDTAARLLALARRLRPHTKTVGWKSVLLSQEDIIALCATLDPAFAVFKPNNNQAAVTGGVAETHDGE